MNLLCESAEVMLWEYSHLPWHKNTSVERQGVGQGDRVFNPDLVF